MALVPLPNVHAYDVMVPSGSDEAAASKEQDSPVQLEVKLAVGSELGAVVDGAITIDQTIRDGSPSRQFR